MRVVERLLFKEMRDGDYLKVQNASNTAPTGGGARDFRYPLKYLAILEDMFATVEAVGDGERRLADIHFQKEGELRVSRDVEFRPEPTPTRPGEVRIGRVGAHEAFSDPPANDEGRVFFVLRLDSGGILHAEYDREAEIRAAGNSLIVAALDLAEVETPDGRAIIFDIDLDAEMVSDRVPSRDLADDEAVDNAIERRVRAGREIIGIGDEQTDEASGTESEAKLVEATYRYELHELAGQAHGATLKALASYLRDLGFKPKESNIDAYIAESDAAVLFEVKSIRPKNERAQTRRAIGQLLDYAYFELPAEVEKGAEVSCVVVFSTVPSEQTTAFLESIDIMTLWLDPESGLIDGTVASVAKVHAIGIRIRSEATNGRIP